MRAMILAAGLGKRMSPLTKETPKALVKVSGKHLIEYSIAALAKVGVQEIMINVFHHAAQIKKVLGNERYGVKLFFSEEETLLGTGGGAFRVLPFFENKPFFILSCDIVTDFSFAACCDNNLNEHLAHIILVKNPEYHTGDFCLDGNRVYACTTQKFTFASMGLYHPDLFKDCLPGNFCLGELLKNAVQKNQVSGELHEGLWFNVGSLQELRTINEVLSNHPQVLV